MFSNFRVRGRARAHLKKKFACAGASLKIFAGACAHVRARALTGAFFLNFLGNKYI
jgi:hypothetical protein